MDVISTKTDGSVPFTLTNTAGFVFLVVGDEFSTRPTQEKLILG